METILIVDDNADLRFNLSTILKENGYNPIVAKDGKDALKAVEKNMPNLTLLDMKLPGMDGIKILEKLKKIDKDLIVIMLTAYADVKDAVRAMKLGAFDYITKPFNDEELIIIITKALQTQHLSREVQSLRRKLGERAAIEEVMGESPQIKRVLRQVEVVAPTTMTVILQGKSGVGKELIANMIHQKSPRKNKPFIAIDCGAIPETLIESEFFGYEKGAFTGAETQKEGKFEQANGGTLLLDEISNLSDAAQKKLLRVIEERKLPRLGGKINVKIDVRIIIATNTTLTDAVNEGKFRDDLFHRLNEFCITLPSLRERKEDIPVLTKCFLHEANQDLNKKVKDIAGEAMKCLYNYYWPGNVRELKNVVKKAVLLCDSNCIKLSHLTLDTSITPDKGFGFQQGLDKGISLRRMSKDAAREVERNAIKETLVKVNGNKTKAAKILKIDRMTLYSKIKEFQLEEV